MGLSFTKGFLELHSMFFNPKTFLHLMKFFLKKRTQLLQTNLYRDFFKDVFLLLSLHKVILSGSSAFFCRKTFQLKKPS